MFQLPISYLNQLERTAIKCLQKNIRKYILVRNWEWWRLYTKVLPLLDVHRAERELVDKNVSDGFLVSNDVSRNFVYIVAFGFFILFISLFYFFHPLIV